MSDLQAKVREAVGRELRARSYDNYPADEELFEEVLDDITEAVMALVEEGKD
jgi:hypothetical protein